MKAIAIIFGAVLLRFLFVSPFMLLFWWIRRSTRKLRPCENGASVEFSLAPRMHVLIEIVTVSLVAFTALTVWEAAREGEGLYAALIPVSVLVAILLAEPRTVLINHDGIRPAPLPSRRSRHRMERDRLDEERTQHGHHLCQESERRSTGVFFATAGRPVAF